MTELRVVQLQGDTCKCSMHHSQACCYSHTQKLKISENAVLSILFQIHYKTGPKNKYKTSYWSKCNTMGTQPDDLKPVIPKSITGNEQLQSPPILGPQFKNSSYSWRYSPIAFSIFQVDTDKEVAPPKFNIYSLIFPSKFIIVSQISLS